MNNLTEKLAFSVPITRDWYQLAETFSREQHEPDKAQDVYLNTLAVYAVNFYLQQCLEVETDLPASDSSNPALRSLMNVSDLMVKGWGKLECRPVLPGDQVCDIPPESRQDRVGYVVVEINQPSNQAKLLGFAKTALGGSLEISKIQSLEQLINQLPEQLPELESNVVKLLEWLKGNFELGWQSVNDLLSPQQLRPAFRNTEYQQQRAKPIDLFDLGLELAGNPVVLIITVGKIDKETASVRAQVYPRGETLTLPANLKLSVLTATGDIFTEVTARSNDEFIQYQFNAQQGDDFGIQVSLGEASVTERFQV
ncbi:MULTISPECIES: DUF1822 family protein [unclassified Moorena]|uniref:DUF1822 family protein n=1 Tax=unclassified Moorena TaxID=2683338 RepID=UPI001400FC6C|nr:MULTISPECIES: DUF1822 family protein [unclassified Moorena]NEO16148.1 DUF1822 family protein [Moorena sp. SIO3E8]NEQ02678.1 DUF1822 family protein [Moorena sp. SIO3F7]